MKGTIINPSISPNLQETYNEQYNEHSTRWRELGGKYKAQNILELCQNFKFNKVLELGAGEGSILKYLDEYNFCKELHALEIDKSGIEFIKKRKLNLVKSVQQFNGYDIPFKDNCFDLLILSHVIEHVEFPRYLLREIKRVSTYQIAEIPCDFTFNVDKKVEYFLSYGHINIYIPTLLRFLLKSEGFEIIKDKLSLMASEVMEYSYYMNNKKHKTFLENIKLNLLIIKNRMSFILASKEKKQLKASAYTVLCKNTH